MNIALTTNRTSPMPTDTSSYEYHDPNNDPNIEYYYTMTLDEGVEIAAKIGTILESLSDLNIEYDARLIFIYPGETRTLHFTISKYTELICNTLVNPITGSTNSTDLRPEEINKENLANIIKSFRCRFLKTLTLTLYVGRDKESYLLEYQGFNMNFEDKLMFLNNWSQKSPANVVSINFKKTVELS